MAKVVDDDGTDASSSSTTQRKRNRNKMKATWNFDPDFETWLYDLPKIELHVHLDGSFDPALLRTHLDQTGLDAPPDFVGRCTCRGKRSLAAMLDCFEFFLPIVRGNLELVERLSFDFVERQARQNVVYTEVRYSPHLLAEGGDYVSDNAEKRAEADPVVDAVTAGLRRGEKAFGVTVNQILCCVAFRPDWAEDVVRIARERRNAAPCAVVGIDVAAGEDHFDETRSPQLHQPHFAAFQEARRLNLNITVHAGEVGDVHNVTKAIERYGARRIGHGYRIAEHPELMASARSRGIHFETCPTSSVETGAWDYGEDGGGDKDWTRHPIVTMLRNELSVGLNSDDPAVFNTSFNWQLRIATAKMGLDRDAVVDSMAKSAEAAFVDDKEKERLKAMLSCFATKRKSGDVVPVRNKQLFDDGERVISFDD